MLENRDTVYYILQKAEDLPLSLYNTRPFRQGEGGIDSKSEKKFKHCIFTITRVVRHEALAN